MPSATDVSVQRYLRRRLQRLTAHPRVVPIRRRLRRAVGEALHGRRITRERDARSDNRRRVLLVAENALMAECIAEAWATLSDDDRITGVLTSPKGWRDEGRAFARELGVEFEENYRAVRRCWWDLVVVATHVEPFHPAIPAVRFPHGIGPSSKIVRGEAFTYGRGRVLRDDGRPVYALICESSNRVRDEVLARMPQLEDRIAVVGSLRVDHVLDAARRRTELRRGWGFEDDDVVIAILSTFGPHSLMETVGPPLFDVAAQTMSERGWRYVVATHPNLWSAQLRGGRAWDDFLVAQRRRGFRIVAPGEDWREAVVVSDVAVTDHTSVSVACALVGMPIVCTHVDPSVLEPGSPIACLREVASHLGVVEDLQGAVDAALSGGQPSAMKGIIDDLCAHRGEAVARVRAELLRLLELR